MKQELFQSEDYRAFLRNAFRQMKEGRKKVSFRYLAREAGFSSAAFLKLVIDGQRNLSLESIGKVAKVLKLNREEAQFFEQLVLYTQATDPADKSRHYERMSRNRRFRDVKALEAEQFEYYSKWYNAAIRELVALPDFKEDPAIIAKRLLPSVTVRQVEQALALILILGLLERDSGGKLRLKDPMVTSGSDVRSLALTNFHREMLARATDSISTVPAAERDLSALTFVLNESKIPELKEHLKRVRQEILSSFDAGGAGGTRVYQLNLQLFPLSRQQGVK